MSVDQLRQNRCSTNTIKICIITQIDNSNKHKAQMPPIMINQYLSIQTIYFGIIDSDINCCDREYVFQYEKCIKSIQREIISFCKLLFLLCSVNMKGHDLFSNIQEARQHINKLKRQAELLDAAPAENNANIHEYVNEVIYSLAKNEQQIDKKHKQLKEKLPSLVQKRDELPQIDSYKKPKYRLPSSRKSKRGESTKIQESLSFMPENRQIKMHSFNEKHIKFEFNSDRNINSNMEIPIPQMLEVNSKLSTPPTSQFRTRHFESKRTAKLIDLNQSNKLNEKKSHHAGYLQPPNKPSHEFLIINGEINDDTPQFASYQRVYQSIFPKINNQLLKLTQLLNNEGVQKAKLDGKKLAYLCLKNKITTNELYSCLINFNTLGIKSYEAAKSKYAGRDGRIKAVNKIISYWKMRNIRDKYQILRKDTIIIQKFFKKQIMKLHLEKQLRQRNQAIMDSFEERQNTFYKQWKQIRNQKRIEIHLNSVQVDEQKRLSMDNFQQRQNIQLSRIFRLKDDNLIIIYITCVDLSVELLNYYYKMMDLAGITNYRERLIFMTPELAHKFPQHFSTSKLLYYSSRTLKQLKIITSEMPTILYPGYPCNELLKICHYIDCYLFSGEPQKMKCFTTKSQTKRLLKNLCIQTLPSTMEMYDYGQFLNTFSVLIIKNPQIQTWVLKIDDEISGRGIAYVNLSSSKLVRSILKKIELQMGDNQTFATEINNDSQNQQATIRIRDYIRDHLHQKLQIATPTVYRNYTDFMGRFIKKGGIIEAHPICFKELLTYPSVTFCLQPDGEYKIITTYEKIISQPYRSLACSFPQRSIEYNQLISIIRQLTDSFKLRKVFGIFTIDFIYQKQENKFWVLGIDPYINDYTSSFYLFDLLMNGTYIPDKDMYLIESTTNNEESSPEDRLATRDYIFIPHMHHRNLAKIKIKDFFKEARLEQFNFDIGNKEGICVILLDQMASGVIGLLAVSNSKEEASELIKRMLDFVSKVSSVKSVDYGRTEQGGSSDTITLKDVHSIFTGFMRKGVRKNAKQRAIKEHQLSRNLQLII